MVRFAVVLGFDAMGAVGLTVRCLKRAAPDLTPLVVLNSGGADYSEILPKLHVLRSRNVNGDHKRLADQIRRRMERIAGRKRAYSIATLINYQDYVWPCFIDLCSIFRVPSYPSADVVVNTSIKPNLRFLARGSRLEVPYTVVSREILARRNPYGDDSALGNLAKRSEFLIVKPIMGAASGGVRRVRSREVGELREAATNALQFVETVYGGTARCYLKERKRTVRLSECVLVEQYIEGTEYSVEGITEEDGRVSSLVVQRKATIVEEPSFRDLEYVAAQPTGRRAIIVRECAERLIRLVGYCNRPFHIEIKEDGSGAKPIEFNPRMGGGSIMDLVTAIHGTDVLAQPLCRFLGGISRKRVYVTRVVQPQRVGVVTSYQGLKYVGSQPDCVFLKQLVVPGTEIRSLQRETYLIEFCIAGQSQALTRRRADYLESKIRPVIEESED